MATLRPSRRTAGAATRTCCSRTGSTRSTRPRRSTSRPSAPEANGRGSTARLGRLLEMLEHHLPVLVELGLGLGIDLGRVAHIGLGQPDAGAVALVAEVVAND